MKSEVFVLDTDHLSFYGRNSPVLLTRLQAIQTPLTTTVISLEEQLRGRLAQVSEAKDDAQKSLAYRWLLTRQSKFQR